MKRDPRLFQIVSLACLLGYGMALRGFDVTPLRALLLLASALATQWVCGRWLGARFEPKSALISGLSLCLLLRTDSDVFAALTAVLTIASKFVFRSPRQARLQPHQPRRRRDDAPDRAGMGVAGPVGERRAAGVPDRVPAAPWS